MLRTVGAQTVNPSLGCLHVRITDEEWPTAYLRSSCKVVSSNGGHEVLGATLGSDAAVREATDDVVSKTAGLREKISCIGDAACELILLRLCADVSELTHSLRTMGDRVPDTCLERFDKDLKGSLETILGNELSNQAWQ